MEAVQFRCPTAQNTSENLSWKHFLSPGPRTRNYVIKTIDTETQAFSRSVKLEVDVLLYGFGYQNNLETCLFTGHKT